MKKSIFLFLLCLCIMPVPSAQSSDPPPWLGDVVGKVIILVKSLKRKNHKIMIDFRQKSSMSH